ncbi:hypothetical protein C8J57DRAFT_1241119 [Mycena rebaudengoi]|nr:hypothetical protein C8J57DRAFT_1241119 [Mycena rebaudengoi]
MWNGGIRAGGTGSPTPGIMRNPRANPAPIQYSGCPPQVGHIPNQRLVPFPSAHTHATVVSPPTGDVTGRCDRQAVKPMKRDRGGKRDGRGSGRILRVVLALVVLLWERERQASSADVNFEPRQRPDPLKINIRGFEQQIWEVPDIFDAREKGI